MTSSWSEQEVALWLQEQSFGEFEDAFVSNNIDGRAIVNLSKEDLEDLGVKAIGKRAALVAAIVECFGKCAANKVEAAAAPAPSASAWQAQPVQQQPTETDDSDHLAHERIKLFVGGLTDSISKDMLQQELQQHAPVDEVIVLMNPSTGTSKGSGFAFVMGKKNAEALMYVPPPSSAFSCRVANICFGICRLHVRRMLPAAMCTRTRTLKRPVMLVCFISAMRDRIVPSVGKVLKVCCAMNALCTSVCVRKQISEEHCLPRLSLTLDACRWTTLRGS
jgi:hypothetical protein